MRVPRRTLLLIFGLSALGLPAPAVARAGGTLAPSTSSGGTEYGASLGKPAAARAKRPVAGVFRVAPRTLTEGETPRLALRIDQRGVRSVRARVVFWPLRGNGQVLRVDLGRVPTGRLLHPAAQAPVPGRYTVRLHAVGPGGGTLLRRASASGRAPLTVKATPVPPPTPAVAAPPPVAPVVAAPAITAEGVFPVQGAHTFGGDDARFGAGRSTHIHEGQDVVAAEGVPVVAPLAGTIIARDYQAAGAGFYLAMDAVDGRSFFFAHCQQDTFAVALGQAVAAGQQLCRVGRTGEATGPHLHFEIWVGGWRRTKDSRPVDPLPQLQAWDH